MAHHADQSAGSPGAVAQVEMLLAQQQELFVRLDGLSSQQAALIQRDETDRLLEVLGERQLVVDEIGRMNAMLEPWRQRWGSFIAGLGAEERERIRRQVDAVAQLAERIARRDDADRGMLEQRKGSLAAELGQVDRGRGAMAAYGGPRSDGPRFQDREA
jgi:hypothetical protein